MLYNSPPVKVWCAMSKYEVIGPYVFENLNVTSITYKRTVRWFVGSKTTRISWVHDFPAGCCSSPLFFWSNRVFWQKATEKIDGKRWSNWVVFNLSRSFSVRLLFMEIHRRYNMWRTSSDDGRTLDEDSSNYSAFRSRDIEKRFFRIWKLGWTLLYENRITIWALNEWKVN